MGKFEFKFPFEPPWEDLKMEMTTKNGTKCYIFDSCVVRDPEERAAINQEIVELIIRNDRRKFLKKLQEEKAAGAAQDAIGGT